MKFTVDDITLVDHNGKARSYLNKSLLEKQNITTGGLDKLKELHTKRYRLVDAMEETDDVNLLKFFDNCITLIDFELQETWGFEKDSKFHRWFELPKCRCPVMDNLDRLGTGYHIINGSCPIHGGNE